MIKKKNQKKVEDWKDYKSGLETAIYLSNTEFIAEILGRTFKADNVALVRKKLTDAVNHWLTMEWFPVMEVEIDDEEPNYREELDKEEVSFARGRYYLSLSPSGETFKVEWDVDPGHRKAQMTRISGDRDYHRHREWYGDSVKVAGLPLNAPLKQGNNRWLLDYDEKLWKQFENIVAGICQLRIRLRELVSTKEGIKVLLGGTNAQALLLKEK